MAALAERRRSAVAVPDEVSLQPSHQGTGRTGNRLVEHLALVEALDARIEVGAGVDHALGRFGQLLHDNRIAVIRMAQPTLRTAPVRPTDLATFDGPLSQQPGDDMHD